MAGKNTARLNKAAGSEGAASAAAGSEGTASAAVGSEGAASAAARSEGTAITAVGSKGAVRIDVGCEGTASAAAQIKGIREMLQAAKKSMEDESERKLRRRANRIRKAMLQDLWARGLTAAPATGRKNGEIAVAAAWAGAGSSAGGDKDRGAIYADMVEDYVALWITRERLEADIAERGVTVFDEKRGLPVENCSVSARVRVSKQMTTIMQTLGYKDQAIKARRPEGDADDEL